MNKLELGIIHCTATPEGRQITKETIREWHTSPPPIGRGWKQVGYSDMIMLDGTLVNLVPYDEDPYVEAWEITNGATGINYKARHIVYVGGTDLKGKPKDTRTIDQRGTMIDWVFNIIHFHPDIKIAGHNQFAQKACPSFHVPTWLRSIGVHSKNIYEVKSNV